MAQGDEVVLARQLAHLVERRLDAQVGRRLGQRRRPLSTSSASPSAAAARVQQHGEVVEHVGGLLVDALVGLLARRAGDLLGLLLDLGADPRRVVEQLDGVGALRPQRRAVGERALERGQRLVRRGRLELAVVKARALAGVARRAGGLDERQQRVAVAVQAQRPDALRVARRRALVPQLAARAAPQVQLAGLARARDRLRVGVGEGQHLPRAPVLDDDRDEAALVVGDLHLVADCASQPRMGLFEVPAEGAIDQRLGAERPQGEGQHPRRERRNEALQAQRATEGRRVGVVEGRVVGQRPLAGLVARDHGAQRPPATPSSPF